MSTWCHTFSGKRSIGKSAKFSISDVKIVRFHFYEGARGGRHTPEDVMSGNHATYPQTQQRFGKQCDFLMQ